MKTLKTILTAPLKAIGLAAAFLLDVLSNINPLLLAIYILSDE
jgi:hypothetical protein